MSNTRPLAQEYANSTETSLDQSRPRDLREGQQQVPTDKPVHSAQKPGSTQDEHPISVGKP